MHDNGTMQRSPFVIASLLVVGPALLAVHLAIDPGPFARSSAGLLATGLLIYGVILATGLLLSRGRWTTRVAIGFAGAQLALGVIVDLGPWAITAILVDLGAIAGLTGPWLSGWIRRGPAADGPGPRVVALLLGAIALTPAVAVANPSGLGWEHLVLAVGGSALALAYSRSLVAALWLFRLALVPLALPAVVASPIWSSIYLMAHVGSLTVLAWTKQAALAATPLLDRIYGPRRSRRQTEREREPT